MPSKKPPDDKPEEPCKVHEYSLMGPQVEAADGKFKYEGNPVPFPSVFPVAQVPPGGYPESHDFD